MLIKIMVPFWVPYMDAHAIILKSPRRIGRCDSESEAVPMIGLESTPKSWKMDVGVSLESPLGDVIGHMRAMLAHIGTWM